MSKRTAAKKELLEILDKKYPNSRKIIEIELDDFLSQKSKLTVKDLDTLEDNIKKLCSWKNAKRPSSIIVEKNILPFDPPSDPSNSYQSKSPSPYMVSLIKKAGKKIVEKRKDHILFPKDYPNFESFSFSNDRRKINENDDWGKIVQADHLRYLSEERFSKLENKRKQKDYQDYLISQITQKQINKKKPNHAQEELSANEETSKSTSKQKQWLDEIMSKKREENESKLRTKLKEQQEMKKMWETDEENERERQKRLRKIRENLAKEQIIQADNKRKTKVLMTEYEKIQSRSLIEENIKKMKESEIKQIENINKRLQFVHDEERLNKLLPKQLKIPEIQGSSFLHKIFETESPKPKNLKYLTDLQSQILEKKNREQAFLKHKLEHDQIVAQQDMLVKQEDLEKVFKRKNTQNELRETYNQAILLKKQSKNKALQLSPSEAELNKKLFQSSLALLESSK